MITTAYAQEVPTPETAADTSPPASPFGGVMPMMILFIAIIYFMLFRPQMRKEKERKKQIESLRTGVKVTFGGGIIGTIDEVKEHTFRVRIAEGTVIEIARGAVNSILSDPAADNNANAGK